MPRVGKPSTTRPSINIGDIVGISLVKVNKKHEVTGSVIAVRGQVTKIYKLTRGSRWRADILWEDKAKGFLYTGKDSWEYLHMLTLVSRKEGNGKRRYPSR